MSYCCLPLVQRKKIKDKTQIKPRVPLLLPFMEIEGSFNVNLGSVVLFLWMNLKCCSIVQSGALGRVHYPM